MFSGRVQITVWILLLGLNGVQFALSLGSEPYVQLTNAQYQIDVDIDQLPHVDVQNVLDALSVAVRHDLYSPLPAAELAIANMGALLLLVLATRLPTKAAEANAAVCATGAEPRNNK